MNTKIRRTRVLISKAVVHLVSTHDIHDISTQMIIDAAGITRPTFYNHFPDIVHAVRATALSMLEEAMMEPPPLSTERNSPDEFRARTRSQILPILQHVTMHRQFYTRVLRQAADLNYFEEAAAMFIRRTDPAITQIAEVISLPIQADMMEIMANGMMWMAIRWLLGTEEAPPEVLADRMTEAILGILAIRSGGV